MEKNQAFRVAGTTADIRHIAVNHVNGQDVIFWEDIECVFSEVKLVQLGQVVLSKLRDLNGIKYNPERIKYYPNEILDIKLFTTVDGILTSMDGQIDLSTVVPINMIDLKSSPNRQLSEAISDLSVSSEPINASSTASSIAISTASSTVSSSAKPLITTLKRASTVDIHNIYAALTEAIELADKSGRPLSKEQLTSLLRSKLYSELPIKSAFESTVIREMGTLHDQGATTQQIVLKVLELQRQMNDRLILIQSKTEAILTQQLELTEYPIPRLFIVLPEKVSKYDAANWFRTKFRLYFICECGEHTQTEGSKTPHHLHLARHEGYLIQKPTEFFKKYGPFLVLMLELIKISASVTSHVVPAFVTFKIIELADSVQQAVETVTEMIDYSLECIGAQALLEALKINSTLTTLNMFYNSIGGKGAQALSETLKVNSTLTTLEMSGNSMGNLGARALSEALKTNSTLTTLNVGDNLIGVEGVEALSEILKTNSTLTALDMSHNPSGAKGIQALSEALKANSRLASLGMSRNTLGDGAAQALSEALKINSTLTTLNLWDNSIEWKGAQALAEALRTNSMLTTLNMSNNFIGEVGAWALIEARKTNSVVNIIYRSM